MKKDLPIFSILFYLVSFISLALLIHKINTPISSLIILIVFSVDLYLGSYCLPKFKNITKGRIMHYTFITMFLVYLIFIISLLFLSYYFIRDDITETRINLIPFATINLYINSANTHTLPIISTIINLLGNIIAFMPFSFYLPLFFKRMNKSYIFIPTMILIVIVVEITQLFLKCGSCDIDDFILNIFGILIFYFILKNKKIKKLINKLTKF